MEPDKECKDCKGTGSILLLNRSVPCFCLNREEKIEVTDEDNDPLELKKLFDQRLKENNFNNWPIV